MFDEAILECKNSSYKRKQIKIQYNHKLIKTVDQNKSLEDLGTES